MWIGLNIGRQRPNFFGTFALSVYSALGAESLRPLAPCTVVLNYGVIAPDGYLVMGAYETSAHHCPAFRPVPGLRGLYMRDPNHRAAA